MSKKETPELVGYGSGYVINDYQLSHLEGRLLTLIESWGLKETQEKACKDLMRNELWGLLNPCFIISGEDHTALRIKYGKEDVPCGNSRRG
jgi:hypothetical protein